MIKISFTDMCAFIKIYYFTDLSVFYLQGRDETIGFKMMYIPYDYTQNTHSIDCNKQLKRLDAVC